MMNEYNTTLTGQLELFVGKRDRYYIDEKEVHFHSKEQASSVLLNVPIALSVNDKNQVYPGDGYYVLT